MTIKNLDEIGDNIEKGGNLFQIKNPVTNEIMTVSKEDCNRVMEIVSELNAKPFGWDSEGGPTNQDYFDTIQYNLNHSSIDDLKISTESKQFIKNCGFFSLL